MIKFSLNRRVQIRRFFHGLASSAIVPRMEHMATRKPAGEESWRNPKSAPLKNEVRLDRQGL
jgi:hypothetical protein